MLRLLAYMLRLLLRLIDSSIDFPRNLGYAVYGVVKCGTRCYPYGRRLAPSAGAASLPPDERKGAVLMVTYSELFLFCDLVIGIISLVILITKKK